MDLVDQVKELLSENGDRNNDKVYQFFSSHKTEEACTMAQQIITLHMPQRTSKTFLARLTANKNTF